MSRPAVVRGGPHERASASGTNCVDREIVHQKGGLSSRHNEATPGSNFPFRRSAASADDAMRLTDRRA